MSRRPRGHIPSVSRRLRGRTFHVTLTQGDVRTFHVEAAHGDDVNGTAFPVVAGHAPHEVLPQHLGRRPLVQDGVRAHPRPPQETLGGGAISKHDVITIT